MTDITRLGKVQWNLTPPTSFMKALLTEGWVSLLIPYPGNLFDNDFRFGFFANNRLLDFKDFSPEMWKAYSSIFNNEDDECDRVFPDGPILESPDQEYFDMFNEMLKETHQETVWARQHPELQDSEESEYVEEKAEYARHLGWNMTGFMLALSNLLKTEVAFFSESGLSEIEIAFKPNELIRNPERRLQSIAQKMSAWVEAQGR